MCTHCAWKVDMGLAADVGTLQRLPKVNKLRTEILITAPFHIWSTYHNFLANKFLQRIAMIFIGPRSDHSLPMSVTH